MCRTMIQTMIKEGKIVPSEVTIKLLEKAILGIDNDKFLIDGFPRNEENRAAFEAVTKIEPEFVLFFDCPEEEMERRLLSRNQGREDDNIETIRKRFKVFLDSSLPVVEYYAAKGKVKKVNHFLMYWLNAYTLNLLNLISFQVKPSIFCVWLSD
ncbi:unnamed protein product [Linum tenue]|uniref:adenylate kinase n=1 Tax=Linum tenue TaxID=586396 RepID=A0AAV0J1Y9_9ROSI|nr:unnamed protein product [Linum tenue]